MTDTTSAEETERRESAPDPDDSRKPESPSDLKRQSWVYVLRKTVREFGGDQCTISPLP